MIAVYVINLARSPERRAWMESELARAGVEAIFVRAVDGRRFSGRCERLSAANANGNALSRAETALILSHRKAWRKLLASGAGHAVVLEDDVHLGEGFRDTLALDWSRWDFDLVKLETTFDRVWLARRGEAAGGRELRRLGAEHHGAAAYLVSRAGAERARASTRRLDQPVDVALFGRRAIADGLVTALQLVPAIAVQDNLHPSADARASLASTLHESDRKAIAARRKRQRPAGVERVRREARRLWEKILRRIRLSPTMRLTRVPFA
jgi:glycosyl transferase family 25